MWLSELDHLFRKRSAMDVKNASGVFPGQSQVVTVEDKAVTYDFAFQTFSKQEDL